MEWETEESSFDSRKGLGIFVFSKSPARLWVSPSPLYSVDTAVPCPVVKLSGCEVDNLNPSKAKVKNTWSHISASLHTFMRCMGKTTLELGYNVMKRFVSL